MRIEGRKFRTDPLATLRRVDADTTKLSRLVVDGVHCVYLNDPALIRDVLENQWPEFRKEFGYKKSRDLIQPDLFSPAARWPTREEFVDMSSELRSIVSNHISASGGQIDDLYAWCRRLTMDIFMHTLLKGSVLPTVSEEELDCATMKVIGLLGRVILQFPSNIDSLDELKFESHDELRAYTQMFQKHPTCEWATPGRAITTLLAGYEQMASIMYWLIVHYAESPFGALPCIEKKHYLNEVIRLHSPIWTIMRRPKHTVSIKDYVFPKNCVVITSPWLMGHNPIYFPEPERFMPARWREPVETFAFFPFSHGPRACKGEGFVRSTMYALFDELRNQVQVTFAALPDKLHTIRVSATPAQRLKVVFHGGPRGL